MADLYITPKPYGLSMNVSLTRELEEYIARKVRMGLYKSASEVVREALRLLHERDRANEVSLAELHRDIQTGLDQLDRGEGIAGDRVLEEIRGRARR